MQKNIWWWVFLLSIFCLVLTPAAAENITVRARGESPISKQDALRRALQAAVEQGIGAYINSQQKINNQELIEDRILKHVSGFIRSSEELSGGEENGTYWVMVKAVVTQDKIVDELTALQLLFTIKGNPRIMVLADTNNLEQDLSGLLQDDINEKFMEKGFLCVDPEILSAARNKEQIRLALAGDTAAAKTLGLESKADVVVTVRAYQEELGEVYGVNPYRVTVSGRAVWTDTGSIISSARDAGADPFGRATEAINKAASGFSGKLLGKVIEKWNNEIINTGLIELLITGLDYDNLVRFQDRLAELTGIRNVYERSYENYSKTSRLEVGSEYSTQTLAQVLSTIQGFQVTIKSRQANKITCEVGAK